jgi:hypothetical protein
VPDGVLLVDVGCGGGKMLRTIKSHRPNVTLLGCDVEVPADDSGDFVFAAVDPASGRLP